MKIHKKGIGIIFVFSGNNDSDIIPKTSRYHSEGRELVKMSVLKEWAFKIGKIFCANLLHFNVSNARPERASVHSWLQNHAELKVIAKVTNDK